MFGNLFKKSSFGLEMGDDFIKFIELLGTKNGLKVGRHGELAIPAGVIESGKIKDAKKLEKVLLSLRKEKGIKSVGLSLPDYDAQNIKNYLSVFKHSGISVKSFESGAEAAVRALIKEGDKETYMIVNMNGGQSVVFVISGGVVAYHSPLSGAIYFLQNEVNKHFLHWHTRKNTEGKNNPPIKKIILCGGEPGLVELSEYLSMSMRHPVEVADVWVNVLDTGKCIPEINFEQSFSFAPALGLALKGF